MAPKKRPKYAVAAAKYKPRDVRVLFIGESPPREVDRYFYFEESQRDDWLWIALMKGLFPTEFEDIRSERLRKSYWLTKFRDSGCFLIDAVKEPISGDSRKRIVRIKLSIPEILVDIQALAPQGIVLVKRTVHAALFQPLKQAGLNVVNQKALPFPAVGNQRHFQEEFLKLAICSEMRKNRIAELEQHLREARIVWMEPILAGLGPGRGRICRGDSQAGFENKGKHASKVRTFSRGIERSRPRGSRADSS